MTHFSAKKRRFWECNETRGVVGMGRRGGKSVLGPSRRLNLQVFALRSELIATINISNELK